MQLKVWGDVKIYRIGKVIKKQQKIWQKTLCKVDKSHLLPIILEQNINNKKQITGLKVGDLLIITGKLLFSRKSKNIYVVSDNFKIKSQLLNYVSNDQLQIAVKKALQSLGENYETRR